MGKYAHIAFHIGAAIVQYAAIASNFVPPPYGAILAGAVAAIQGGVAAWNHAKGK